MRIEIDVPGGHLKCALHTGTTDRAVVFLPGYAEDARDEKFEPLAEELAQRGIALLRMNYRAGPSKEAQDEMTIREMVQDISYARHFLQQMNSIAVVARSMSAGALLASQIPFDLAALWAPVGYPEEQGRVDIRKNLHKKIGELHGKRVYSRANDLQWMRMPVRIFHGSEDDVVPLAYATWLANVLPDAELEVLADDHIFTETMDELCSETTGWIDENL